MQQYGILPKVLLVCTVILTAVLSLKAQETTPSNTVPVRMTVTVYVLGDRPMPEINREDVIVTQGRDRLHVTEWVPAKGDRAGLDLFVLIDDALDTSFGSHINDLRAFINNQAPTTSVGVGYMRNATVQILQNFTTDHDQAARVVRLPIASPGAFGSPYLSVINLMNRWPSHPNRRTVVMISDGIDRARRGPGFRGLGIIPDANSASDVAQRTGTMIHTIYAPGVGRLQRNFFEANTGQNSMAKLSDDSGGESFFLGFQSPVSIRPYLDTIQNILGNQYLLEFQARPGRRAGLQSIRLATEVAGVEFASANSVWVPAASR